MSQERMFLVIYLRKSNIGGSYYIRGDMELAKDQLEWKTSDKDDENYQERWYFEFPSMKPVVSSTITSTVVVQ